jgi:membrane protease YdiL (CAAX protease family)
MMRIRETARRHPVLTFALLACALSWWPWPWFELDPVTIDAPIFPFGPFLAALIVLMLIGGWPAAKDWLSGIVRWRVGLQWYAVALILPPALILIAAELNLLLGAHMLAQLRDIGWLDLVPRFIFILLWIGLGEEPAWRGFALPRLLDGRSALAASLLLGAIHAIWHAPLFGVEYDSQSVWPWGLSVFCFAIVVTWLWLHTGRSLLLPMLMHASNNTAAIVWGMFSPEDQRPLWWIWAGLWITVTAVVVIATGPSLTGRTARRPQSAA